mmetsp:Transcript_56096/g.177756  ORF Transcript_56096/g.177756 Transcript_56096/m.177756 type:complete len:100 (-) Transcript_56096:170-469(-)
MSAAGAPPFSDLPPEGQALALLWCAVGPLAFLCSRAGGLAADAGLVIYGAVEVGCAWAIGNFYHAAAVDAKIVAFPNSVAVQAVVAAAWLYSWNKQREA